MGDWELIFHQGEKFDGNILLASLMNKNYFVS